ncbi:hypothetical protein ACFXOI_05675 [Streptomyces bacillaris]|uniref:hypothetical protein n=1 Tax=Streptomyces bacillaris TaxID=68179 RepID=UPI0036C1F556
MSLTLTIRCDAPYGPYGGCGAYLPTGSTDQGEAYATAVRAGWQTGPDRCPGHAYWPRPVPPIQHLHPTTKETPTP